MNRLIVISFILSMFLFFDGYAQQSCLVLSLPFNGSALDQSGNFHNVTVSGASLVADRFGTPNSAYSFDGVDDFISVMNDALFNFDVNDNFSISLWIKAPVLQMNTNSPGNEILTKWEDNGGTNEGYPFAVRMLNSTNAQEGKIRVVRWDRNCTNLSRSTSSSTLNDNVYHHIVYIKDSTSVAVYIDNSLEGSFVDSSVCKTSNTSDLFIGKVGGSTSPNYYQGAIDDIYIYNCAITPSRVDSLYFDGVNTSTTATINPSACSSYTSPSGNSTWTVSGTYMDTIPNTQGGDSLITINLTILLPTTSTISPTECLSFTSPSGNYTWNTSGNFTDTIQNSAGCDSILFVDLTIVMIDTSIMQNGNMLTSSNANATYQWTDCNNGYAPLPGEISQSFTATGSGSYAVILTENGCTDTSGCRTTLPVGIANHSGQPAITLYPNPTNGSLFIEGVLGRYAYTIYDLPGKSLLRNVSASNPQLDVGALPKGTYFIRINTGHRSALLKFVLME